MNSKFLKSILFVVALSFLISIIHAAPIPAPAPEPEPMIVELIQDERDSELEKRGAKAPPSGTMKGQATWFNPDLGACGKRDNDNSPIVALSGKLFDPYTPNGNPNKNTLCGKKVRITFKKKSVVGRVSDRCPPNECNFGDIDLSPKIFNQFAKPSVGRINVTWRFA